MTPENHWLIGTQRGATELKPGTAQIDMGIIDESGQAKVEAGN